MSELQSSRWQKLCNQLKRSAPPVCWWCGKPIDLSLSGRDPMGWTADHIVPRSVDPSLTWELSNIRPAHHKCNTTRGNGHQPVNASRKWR